MPEITSVDTTGAVQRLERLRRAGQAATPLMRQVGAAVQAEIRENFDRGGRPRWRANAPSTVRQKGHSRPLVSRRSRPSRLEQSVITARPTEVEIRTIPEVREYARIHQYGGRAGRNSAVRIPARPYRILGRPFPRRLNTSIRRLIRAFFREAA